MRYEAVGREERLAELGDIREIVDASPHATFFHNPSWLSVVDRSLSGGLRILRVLRGKETVAILPHAHLRRGQVQILLSPPSGFGIQYLGPLVVGWDRLKQDKREGRLVGVAEALVRHLHETKARYCQVRAPPGLEDARAFQWSGFDATPRYTYVLPIEDETEVWESMKKSVRYDIQRHRDSVDVRVGTEADWELFERQARGRYSEQGLTAPLPEGYVGRLREALGNDLALLVARNDSGWLGAAALIHFRGRMALWQGTMKGSPGIPTNDILVWQSICYARERGCHRFELMGANTKRLAQFKSKFNPRLESYLEITKGTLLARVALIAARTIKAGGT